MLAPTNTADGAITPQDLSRRVAGKAGLQHVGPLEVFLFGKTFLNIFEWRLSAALIFKGCNRCSCFNCIPTRPKFWILFAELLRELTTQLSGLNDLQSQVAEAQQRAHFAPHVLLPPRPVCCQSQIGPCVLALERSMR